MQDLTNEVIPAAVVTAINKGVNDAKNAVMPYVTGLTKEQRKSLNRMGDKSRAFAEKAGDYMVSNPDLVPRRVNVADFTADLTLYRTLAPILGQIDTLRQMVADTMMAAGSDLMEAASAYYRSAQDAAIDGDAAANSVYDELKQRYPGANRRNA